MAVANMILYDLQQILMFYSSLRSLVEQPTIRKRVTHLHVLSIAGHANLQNPSETSALDAPHDETLSWMIDS